ncbi:MAG: NAD-dependent epimerase/dehydratase family protein [Deinococcota bacterium]
MDGLIGYTGFVGSNLLASHTFDKTYNSKNIADIASEEFDLVVCAAPQAVKWWANKHPDEDKVGINRLTDSLKKVNTKRFVHLSTVDVFPVLNGVDESFDCHSQDNHAYGRHRLELEDFITETFDTVNILRLPALFGNGLKKNVIFDLLNGNMLNAINPASSFQWYPLAHLWGDIRTLIEHDIELCMLATEPVTTGWILERFFPDVQVGAEAGEAHYDVHTQYAHAFKKEDPYMMNQAEVLAALGLYLIGERAKL